MRKIIRMILYILGTLIVLIAVFWICFSYVTNYKKTICDVAISEDKKYELTLMAIGEPDWPFGSANGWLILNENKNKISQTDFELRNDGAMISSHCWKVTWHEDYVEVILSGSEQSDEYILLYFDGQIEMQ